MIFNFQTQNENAAIAALLVYGIYRSRDAKKFKVTPDMWGMIERAVKSSAKRALDLNDFIEKLKPKMHCSTIHPKWMKTNFDVVSTMYVDRETGVLIEKKQTGERREFWTEILEEADHETVLDVLYQKTSLVISLVRDRLEREKPIESIMMKEDEEDGN